MAEVTKEYTEANSQLEEAQSVFGRKSCPVFRELCRGGRCHSYYKGGLSKPYSNSAMKVHKPCCTSPLVTGIIEHEEP